MGRSRGTAGAAQPQPEPVGDQERFRGYGQAGESRSRSIKLDTNGALLDVAEFQQAAAGESIDELQAAAALYRGPLLDGFHVRGTGFEESELMSGPD